MSRECSGWIVAEQHNLVFSDFEKNDGVLMTNYYLPYSIGMNLSLNYCPWCGSELDDLGCTKNKESDTDGRDNEEA